MRRRSFLTAAGLSAVTPLAPALQAPRRHRRPDPARAVARAGEAPAAEWSDAEKANVKLVTDFCASWSTRDLKQVFPRFAETGVYRMSDTTPPVHGPAAAPPCPGPG